MCTKSAEMYGSAILDRRGSVGYRGFRADLCALIEPFYPKPGNGRPPVGVERMLRIYLLQHWFNLSDPAVEEALYGHRQVGAPCRPCRLALIHRGG